MPQITLDELGRPTAEYVRRVLAYDRETGAFSWRQSPLARWIGKPAGAVQGNGYLRVNVAGKCYAAHRLAWLYETGDWPPAGDVDHINGSRADNRFINLRLATRSQNSANARRRSDNRSGYKGVSYSARRREWEAYVGAGGKKRHLGWFKSPEPAHAAYVEEAERLYGAFARAG